MTEDQKRLADAMTGAALAAVCAGAVVFLCWTLHQLRRDYRAWMERMREEMHIAQWEADS